jgi:hypothetical protein
MKQNKPAKSPAPRASRASHHPHMRHASRSGASGDARLFEVRRSGIHGRGAYATRDILNGTRIVEYLGERITHKQADARYEGKGQDDGHTFLFVVSSRVVIDAGVGGNDARFINHSCDPNCDTVIENERVFIEAIRDIKPGEELGYEYGLTWESTDDPEELGNYDCRCGTATCRGTMLAEVPQDQQKAARRKTRKRNEAKPSGNAGGKARAKAKGKTASKSKAKAKSNSGVRRTTPHARKSPGKSRRG